MNKNNLNPSVQVMQDSSAIKKESKGDEKNQHPPTRHSFEIENVQTRE